MKSDVAVLSDEQQHNLGRENDLLKSRISALMGQQQKFVREKEQNKSEMAALKGKMKLDVAVRSEQQNNDTAGIQAILDQVNKENKSLKAANAKSLADAESAKAEQLKQESPRRARKEQKRKSKRKADKAVTRIKSKQANDDRVFNLILKRKQLQDAGISDSVIDEQLPLPKKEKE
jgi:hypothetical protein